MDEQWPQLPFAVKATYSWSGEQKNDLGFLEGDIIEVSKVKGLWFYGRLLRNKKTGSFPANYVEIINKPQPLTSKNMLVKSKQRVESHVMTSNTKRTTSPLPRMSTDYMNTNTADSYMQKQYAVQSKSNNTNSNKQLSQVGARIFPISKSSPNIHRHIAEESRYNDSHMGSAKRSNDRHSQNHNHHHEQIHQSDGYVSSADLKSKNLPSIPSTQSQYDISNRYDMSSSSSSSFDKSIVSFTQTKYWQSSQDKDQLASLKNQRIGTTSSSINKYNQRYNQQDFYETAYEEDDSYDRSFATMSNFSATSAGSFARHKFAKSFTDSKTKQDLPRLVTSFNINNGSMTSLLQDSPANIPERSNNWFLKKIKSSTGTPTSGTSNGSYSNTSSPLNNKKFPELPDLSQLSLQGRGDEVEGWAMVNRQLNRANTLSGKEKYERRKRFLDEAEEDTDIVLEPHTVMIQSINSNEVVHRNGKPLTKPGMVDLSISDLDIEYIDMKTLKRIQKNNVQSIDSFAISNFGNLFKTSLERLRAIFVFCTETFKLIDDNGNTNFKKPPMDLNEILHKGHCTPYELTWIFKKLANSIGVHCEIVIGFLKTPNTNNLDFQLNHCWLTLIINDEWRFVDVILGNTSNPIHEYVNGKPTTKAEDFYFLTEPLKLINSHIPYRTKDQHIIPEIDNILPMCLPTTFPNFFKNDLKFYRFDNSLSFLKNSEVYEMSLFLSNDVEIFASLVIDDVDKNHYEGSDLSLVQIKWHKQRRIAFIKAVLPPGSSKGNLHIHSGAKGLQSTFVNIHPLSVVIPLKHSGNDQNNKFEFVRILPTITASNVDLYIKRPENKYVYQGYEYTFQTILQPSDGIVATDSYGFTSSKNKLVAVQSPSGRVYKYKKNDTQSEFGTWELKIKLNEAGIWTGLVTNDSGAGFASYAEWTCLLAN